MSLLEIQHVAKTFGRLRAVDDVNLVINAGEILAIVGESGSGKTTLAKMMMGLTKPDSGLIESRVPMQMIFQDPHSSLDPLWNIRAILKEGLGKRLLSSQKAEERMGQMLLAVGLSPQILNRFPHEFSGGERQRIALARALLASPQVLILDEAVSALDTLVQQQVIALLRQLKEDFNLTYVFISHNLRLVRHFSDKIAVMYQGKIVEEGQTQMVFQAPQHPYTRQLLEAAFKLR